MEKSQIKFKYYIYMSVTEIIPNLQMSSKSIIKVVNLRKI